MNHLGINLYSNVSAVLAEVVANSWDADAEMVKIGIDFAEAKIIIEDDGHGMTRDDINEKYLYIGYDRRQRYGEATTPKFGRKVMGRTPDGHEEMFDVVAIRGDKVVIDMNHPMAGRTLRFEIKALHRNVGQG